MSIAIQVENLSKAYQIGQIGTGTISRDLERWWATTVRGKEDPFLKIGETNDRSVKGESDIVWSLKDINFEIQQGDAVGIIGRNGAGKSTLLKLLSEVTSPTTGKINIKGRVASLLEVGTGFHPELTGRENIFLNGAILGMRKKEIQRKLDQIIDFSGVERYVDTPVKRYSSGMYVRLAFAVAAHLESEILIVDEVLAVGDAEFQKKCLGKMNDVSKGEGRTVLFVSHNMGSILQLCNKGVILKNGLLVGDGKIRDIVDKYILNTGLTVNTYEAKVDCNKDVFLKAFKTLNKDLEESVDFQFDDHIILDLSIVVQNYNPLTKISITIQNSHGEYLSTIVENLSSFYKDGEKLTVFKIKLPSKLIAPNTYAFRIALFVYNQVVYDLIEMACPIKIYDSGTEMSLFEGINYGSFFMNHEVIKR